MTRPNVIFFGFDSTPGKPDPKVFLRCLLYSTSAKGQLVESLYVRLSQGESVQNFSIWVYGDKGALSRGSGLFVGRDGIASDHHFLMQSERQNFIFSSGEYEFHVYANLVGNHNPVRLFQANLSMSEEQARGLANKEYGLYFDWGPDSRRYYARLDKRPNRLSEDDLAAVISAFKPKTAGQTIHRDAE